MDAVKAARDAREMAELAFAMFTIGVTQAVDCPDITLGETRGLYLASLAYAWGISLDDIAKAAKLHADIRSKGRN